MIDFLKQLFCKHDWELWYTEPCGELWAYRTYICKKCSKTCLAIGPAKAEKIDEITGELKLL